MPYIASNRRDRSLMTLPIWGRKVLLLAIIPVPPLCRYMFVCEMETHSEGPVNTLTCVCWLNVVSLRTHSVLAHLHTCALGQVLAHFRTCILAHSRSCVPAHSLTHACTCTLVYLRIFALAQVLAYLHTCALHQIFAHFTLAHWAF